MKKSLFILGLVLSFYGGHASEIVNDFQPSNFSFNVNPVNPFCSAIAQGDLEMVQKLIALGEDVNRKSNGKTPLQYAARYNRLDIASLLLEKGAKLGAKCDKGFTALKYAELSNALDVAQLLKTFKSNA